MNWAKKITPSVAWDAWLTWNKHFRKKILPELTKDAFYELIEQQNYKMMSMSFFLKTPPENMNVDRLRAKSSKEAYPPNDRPRGQADLRSIRWHCSKKEKSSPIVMIRSGKKMILLDGMHRLVAAKLTGTKRVRALILG